jgi:plasmid stabilization system protein ParE
MASYRFTKQAQKDIQRIIEQGREQFGIKQAITTPRKRKLAKT